MDRLTPEQRRKCMQANKSKGTKPEQMLAKAMWTLGLRYRRNSKTIFGKPDFSFTRYKIAVFIDGEFWHGKNWQHKKERIKSNREFWISKIEYNICHDIEVTSRLENEGWTVLRFWGNDIIKYTTDYAEIIWEIIQEKTLRRKLSQP